VKTDPYFVASGPSTQFKTSVKKNKINARFEEDFHFPVVEPNQDVVRLLARDEDVTADDDISSCEIQIGILPFGAVLDTRIELTAIEKVKRGGRAHVLLHFTSEQATPFVAGGTPADAVGHPPGAWTAAGTRRAAIEWMPVTTRRSQIVSK
jgi:Ca2+-dependent lipid-binding protein